MLTSEYRDRSETNLHEFLNTVIAVLFGSSLLDLSHCKDTTFLRPPPYHSVVLRSTDIRPPSTYQRINGRLSTVRRPHTSPSFSNRPTTSLRTMDAVQSLALTTHVRGPVSRSIFHPFFPLFISLRDIHASTYTGALCKDTTNLLDTGHVISPMALDSTCLHPDGNTNPYST
jgi:hypothetical protein